MKIQPHPTMGKTLVLSLDNGTEVMVPEYSSERIRPTAQAILLGMLDWTWNDSILQEVCKSDPSGSIDTRLSACMVTLPAYCRYYSQKDETDYETLKQEVTKLILESKIMGML